MTLVGLLLVAAAVSAQERREVPTFPSRTELVTVDAVVLDSAGRPVRGLSAQDFSLSEDGKRQAIVSFEAFDLGAGAEPVAASVPPGPVTTNLRPARATASSFVLLVDDMSLAPSRQETVRTALTRFLTDGVRDGDELIYATTSGDAWWTTRTPEGREDVLALVGRVRGRSLADTGKDAVSEWEAYRISHWEGRGEGEAGGGAATGPPSGSLAPQPGRPTSAVAGSSTTQRVVDRYYQNRICIPDLPAATPPSVCRGLVFARAQQVDARRRNRTRDTLAAIDRVVFTLTGIRGRKALLLLTEGFLNDPDLDLAQEVAGRCREANIAVYSLDVRGLITGLAAADAAGTPNTAELGAMQVEQIEAQAAGSVGLAEDTGGFAVRNTNDLGGGAARIGEESRVYYLLGYAPPEGKGPRDWRTLRVEVGRPGLKVRARKGYTLRTAAEIATAAEARLAAQSRPASTKAGPVQAAARAPLLPADVARALAGGRETDAIPLRAMAYAFEGRPAGAVRTLIAIEADMRSLANLGGEEHPRTVVTLSIAAAHRDSGQTQRINQRIELEAGPGDAGATRPSAAWDEGWLALSRELDLLPGVTQARIVMRDEFLGRLGALTLRFVVPPAAGLRLSTPVITNRVSAARAGLPSRPVLVAHREFPSGDRLYCQFEVFGAARRRGAGPQVEASYELRRRDGDVVRRSEPSLVSPSADGRLLRLLALPLDGIAQGDYELVLRIEDKATGQSQERIEPLRVTGRAG
ncbi:MAG TPA: VWA domain-containing protein [Vicinamibacteria bacterium]